MGLASNSDRFNAVEEPQRARVCWQKFAQMNDRPVTGFPNFHSESHEIVKRREQMNPHTRVIAAGVEGPLESFLLTLSMVPIRGSR